MDRKHLEAKLTEAGIKIKDGKIRRSEFIQLDALLKTPSTNTATAKPADKLLQIEVGCSGSGKDVGSKTAVLRAAKKNKLLSIKHIKIEYMDSDIDEDSGKAEYFNEITLQGTKADLVKLLKLGDADIGNGDDKDSIAEIMKDAKPVKTASADSEEVGGYAKLIFVAGMKVGMKLEVRSSSGSTTKKPFKEKYKVHTLDDGPFVVIFTIDPNEVDDTHPAVSVEIVDAKGILGKKNAKALSESILDLLYD